MCNRRNKCTVQYRSLINVLHRITCNWGANVMEVVKESWSSLDSSLSSLRVQVKTSWKERCVDVAHKHPAKATPSLTKFLIIKIQIDIDIGCEVTLALVVALPYDHFLVQFLELF